METIFTLGMVFSAVDQVSGPLKSMIGNISKAHPQVGKLIKSFKTLAITGAVLFGVLAAGKAVFSPMIANAGDFEQALVQLSNTSKATQEELQRFDKKAIQLGVVTEWSPKEALAGMNELAAAGLDADSNLQAIRPTLNAASAGGLELAQSARTVAGGLNAFQLSADKAAEVVDVYTRATQIAPLYLKDFETAIGQVGAKAKMSNQSLHETVAVLGAVRKTGMSASEAATRIKAFLNQVVQKESKMNAMGLSVRNASGELLPMTDIVERLSGKLNGMSGAQRDLTLQQLLASEGADVYGAVMGTTFKTIVNGKEVMLKGVEAVRAMRGELVNSTGTAKAFADANNMTWNGMKKMLGGTMETISIVLGRMFLPHLKVGIVWVTTFANTVLKWINANQEAVKSFGKWAAIIGGTVAGLITLGVSLKIVVIMANLIFSPFKRIIGLFGLLKKGGILLGKGLLFLGKGLMLLGRGFITLIPKVIAFGVALLANPITWIVLGVIALVVAIGSLIYYWDEVAAAVSRFAASMPDWILYPLAVFAPFIGIPLLIVKYWDQISTWFSNFYTSTVEIFKSLPGEIETFFKSIPGMITGFFESIPDIGGRLIDTIINGLKAKGNGLYTSLKGVLGPLGKLLPQSDAKEGPLSKLTLHGKKIVTTIAAGVAIASPALAVETSKAVQLPKIQPPVASVTREEGKKTSRHTDATETGRRSVSIVIEKLVLPDVREPDEFIELLSQYVDD